MDFVQFVAALFFMIVGFAAVVILVARGIMAAAEDIKPMMEERTGLDKHFETIPR